MRIFRRILEEVRSLITEMKKKVKKSIKKHHHAVRTKQIQGPPGVTAEKPIPPSLLPRKQLEKKLQNEIVINWNLLKMDIREPGFTIFPLNKTLVGQFLITRKEGVLRDEEGNIIRNIVPHVLRADRQPGSAIRAGKPRPNPFEPYGAMSLDLLRSGLFDPDRTLQNIDIVIGRGCLSKLMKCFDNYNNLFISTASPKEQFTFKIKRFDNFIMIEDPAKWNIEPSYGYSFEYFMSKDLHPTYSESFLYRHVSYQLQELRILVRYEVDCVLDNPPIYSSVEIKSHSARFPPKNLDYWYACATTDTEDIVIGSINKHAGIIESITHKNVNDLLTNDHEAKKNRFAQIYKLLKWIHEEMIAKNGMEAILHFHRTKSPHKLIMIIQKVADDEAQDLLVEDELEEIIPMEEEEPEEDSDEENGKKKGGKVMGIF